MTRASTPAVAEPRGPAVTGRRAPGRRRQLVTWPLCAAGLLAYNWWLLVPLKPGLMTSPDELFSNLEVTGQPYATAMQHADVLAGILLTCAFLAAGWRSVPAGRKDWLGMAGFAIAGAIGGLFPEVCADGINAVCRRQELQFRLAASQYVHVLAGIAEFAAITVALYVAVRRTRRRSPGVATAYRWLGRGALICYPLLGAAYLTDRMGGVMEAVFFAGFSVMVVTQITERTGRSPAPEPARAGPSGAELSSSSGRR
jgi:hypothetical protein